MTIKEGELLIGTNIFILLSEQYLGARGQNEMS